MDPVFDLEEYYLIRERGDGFFVVDPETEEDVAGPFPLRSDAEFTAGYLDGYREFMV